MTTATIDPTDLLRQAGLRVTAPRVAILTELARLPHVDVDTLSQAARERLGSVSTQAVYDVLRVLTTHEIVRRFEPAGQPARYEINTGDNHHHIVCRTCGTFGDVECAAGQRPCLDVVDAHGFLIDEAEVLYWGLCPTCQAAAKAP
ncbi:MAG: transcriptional repressor [Actinobacteria bacterium]|jgi:Fe2+/Zn2+ uptake regulation proteins|nr:transcriptional repressor [Actinomycetota bacterium]